MMFTYSSAFCAPPGFSSHGKHTLQADWFTQHARLDATGLHIGRLHTIQKQTLHKDVAHTGDYCYHILYNFLMNWPIMIV